ncbi:hypothetical protein LCGC14_0876810, partial [marine sediment metagenome]
PEYKELQLPGYKEFAGGIRIGDIVDDKWLFASTCFRKARMIYGAVGNRRATRHMYVCEMDAYRSSDLIACSPSDWCRLSVMKYLFGYGEKPLWFAGWVLLIIFAFATIYCPSQWGFIDIELRGVDWNGSLLSNFGTALYFSIVTFATLGYGDISPHGGWAKFFVCVEVALGFIMLGCFIVLIGRQITHD